MKGFTLIELIIYIAIASLVLTLIGSFSWDIIYGSTRVASYREVQQNARFALERVIRDLRINNNPGAFSVSDDILYQDGIALTTYQVKVTNFTITSVANTYLVDLRVEYNNPGVRSEYEAVVDLNSTVSLLPAGVLPECWGINDSCDSLCQYTNYGSLVDYYIDPGCSDSCSMTSFYSNPSGACSSDGTGICYKMIGSSNQALDCDQGESCEGNCIDTCTACRNFGDEQSCTSQLGCNWDGRRCKDRCEPCDSGAFLDQTSCENQDGCSWDSTKWLWNLSNFEEVYSSYLNCEWYVQ